MFRCLKRGPGFYGYLWRLTGPIALQNLITFSLGLIDTLMVSWLGNTQMAAVTTANVPVFLLISIVFGVQSGLGILVSQYWGKKDMESISRAIGVAAMLGTGITLVLAVVLFLWPVQIMDLLTQIAKDRLVIMVTHNDAIRLMADRVVRLRDGAIRSNETNAVKVPAQDLEW